jgi:hypothetical protein
VTAQQLRNFSAPVNSAPDFAELEEADRKQAA